MTVTLADVDDSLWPRRQYRAPQSDRGLLVEPGERSPAEIVTSNRTLLDSSDVLIGKETLASLRRACRRDVLRNACEYTSRLRETRPEMPSIDDDLIVVGHQPGLFHPGVWLKHWTAAAVAKRTSGVALNVVIDNDLCENLDVVVPVGPAESPSTQRVALDAGFESRPWEDARLHDPDAFRDGGERLCAAMKDWGYEPIACDAWAQLDHVDENDSVVDHLTRIRHREQMDAGVELLEVPMRNVARLPSFAQFVAHIVQNIGLLSASYNEGLAIYRRLNKLRSHSHPMPDLARDGDLYETPLWVWRAGDEHRRPLWARIDGCGVRLFDRDGAGDAKPIGVVRDGDCTWDVWHRMLTDLDQQGYRVRPRALMTTLFLRLCLSDLFVHGIGGAKYDEVTDWIVRRFVGLEPPEFLTVSGTFRLPLKRHGVDADDVGKLKSTLRDMVYNPDRHGATGPLVDEKEALIAEQRDAADGHGSARENHQRYQRLRAINAELATQIYDERRLLQNELADAETLRYADRVLAGREYSWTLFPKLQLRDWLSTAADDIAAGCTED